MSPPAHQDTHMFACTTQTFSSSSPTTYHIGLSRANIFQSSTSRVEQDTRCSKHRSYRLSFTEASTWNWSHYMVETYQQLNITSCAIYRLSQRLQQIGTQYDSYDAGSPSLACRSALPEHYTAYLGSHGLGLQYKCAWPWRLQLHYAVEESPKLNGQVWVLLRYRTQIDTIHDPIFY